MWPFSNTNNKELNARVKKLELKFEHQENKEKAEKLIAEAGKYTSRSFYYENARITFNSNGIWKALILSEFETQILQPVIVKYYRENCKKPRQSSTK